MGMLEEVIKQLPSKRFGDNITLYFDKDKEHVVLIEVDDTYTYLVENEDDNSFTLKNEIDSGVCVDCTVDPERIWVVPELMLIQGAEEIDHGPIKNKATELIPSIVYELRSYTILEQPQFKGSLFSNSLIKVIMTNGEGKVFAVPFIVGEGVRGCDGNPEGRIMGEAYTFSQLGSFSQKGTLVVKL